MVCSVICSYVFLSSNDYIVICKVHNDKSSISIKNCDDNPGQPYCPVGWGSKMHRLHLFRRVRPSPNECPDMTLNNMIVKFQ